MGSTLVSARFDRQIYYASATPGNKLADTLPPILSTQSCLPAPSTANSPPASYFSLIQDGFILIGREAVLGLPDTITAACGFNTPSDHFGLLCTYILPMLPTGNVLLIALPEQT